MSVRENAKVIGWLGAIIAQPAFFLLRHKGKPVHPDSYYDPPESQIESEGLKWCHECISDTDHLFITWRDTSDVTEAECQQCGTLTEIQRDIE